MKKAIYYTIGLFWIMGIAACDDFLDIKPKGILIPEYVEDYEKLLNHAQLLKLAESWPVYMTDDIYLTDEGIMSYEELDVAARNAYTFQSEIYGEGEADQLWELSYKRIFYYNVIIDEVMEAKDATEQKKKALRAEALLGRSLEYLTLINAYGKAYDKNTAASDPGVPLMLDQDVNQQNLHRASVAKVYGQILEDLKTALPDLPDQPVKTAWRGSEAAGYGVLARMYLYMGEYKLALYHADKALELKNELLDMTQCRVVDSSAYIGRIDVPYAANNPENIYMRVAPLTYGLSGYVYASDELISKFDSQDMRYQLYYTKLYGDVLYDYFVWGPDIYWNMAVSVPELQLIAAECEARVGTKEKAEILLEEFLKKRIKGFTNLPDNNVNILQRVLDERRKEFALVGCMRFFDLKRLNKEEAFAKTIRHVVKGIVYTLEPNSPKYNLPIPPKVLAFNPGMFPNVRE